MKKKVLYALAMVLILVFTAGILAGCGGAKTEAPTAPTATEAPKADSTKTGTEAPKAAAPAADASKTVDPKSEPSKTQSAPNAGAPKTAEPTKK